MSIAHLKELVVAITCLDQEYVQVIQRLKGMKTSPKSKMYEGAVGFVLENAAKMAASQAGAMPCGR